MINYRGLDESEVFVAHSGTKRTARKQSANSVEAEIGRLVSIDQPGNKVKVVVNVFQLSEGWDVTNVWVIAPLRSLASFTNAIQTIGRGLRLPNGRRVGDDEIDTLDVLCFGKEDFGTIVSQATEQFGDGPEGTATVSIVGRTSHQVRVTRPITLKVVVPVTVKVPTISRVPGEPELTFTPQITRGISSFVEVYDVGSGEFGTGDGAAVRRSFEAVVRSATAHVMDGLRFLDPVKHTAQVQQIVEKVLLDLGAKPGMEIATDAVKLGLGVMEAIRVRYRSIDSMYVAAGDATELKMTSQEVSLPIEFPDIPLCNEISEWK